MQRLFKTKAIVLRTVKYGDTSLVVLMLTELFGVQSYLVSGVRSTSKKGASKAGLFQPAAMLDLVVYHNELKNLQRIKEFRWHHLYEHIFSDVTANAVALFMVELLSKSLKQPEENPDLFAFTEDSFLHLDGADAQVTANFPLFFALHLAGFFGFRVDDRFSERNSFLDLREGSFVDQRPTHPQFLEERAAAVTAELLRARRPEEIADIRLHHDFRRNLLFAYETYYALHVQEFGAMKTLPVLRDLLG
ncbi:MAG TPA: DNA repair protein RecO [Chitinophagaceae bacterium]